MRFILTTLIYFNLVLVVVAGLPTPVEHKAQFLGAVNSTGKVLAEGPLQMTIWLVTNNWGKNYYKGSFYVLRDSIGIIGFLREDTKRFIPFRRVAVIHF